MLLAQVERRLEIAERLARCIEDPRAPDQIRYEVAEMIRFRALAIAAGYPDANDRDVMRKDVAFKMAVGRLPETGADRHCHINELEPPFSSLFPEFGAGQQAHFAFPDLEPPTPDPCIISRRLYVTMPAVPRRCAQVRLPTS